MCMSHTYLDALAYPCMSNCTGSDLADIESINQHSLFDIMPLQMSMLRSDELTQLRSTCINMVLGTDMKKHFDIMSRFQVSMLPL